MEKKQFERWEDFAIRMAKHCYPDITDARRKKIIEEVESFFDDRKYEADWTDIMDWDGNGDDFFLCDYVDEFYDNHRHWNRREECYTGKFFNQVTSCIQSGFDMAISSGDGTVGCSAGVIGFSAGDIRRMYQRNVPKWIKALWYSFDAIPDEAEVWL
jgi:hypothetical protein